MCAHVALQGACPREGLRTDITDLWFFFAVCVQMALQLTFSRKGFIAGTAAVKFLTSLYQLVSPPMTGALPLLFLQLPSSPLLTDLSLFRQLCGPINNFQVVFGHNLFFFGPPGAGGPGSP